MRVLLLHSDVSPDAPPDELDTLVTAEAVAAALPAHGHYVTQTAFVPIPFVLDRAVADSGADVVFNLVESVFSLGNLAGIAPAMLAQRGLPFTGASAAAIGCCADKPFTKRFLRAAGLPTPDWSEPPRWEGLAGDQLYVVKSATEDCSVGLDDGSVVHGRDATRARAALGAARHGGDWFAESYCPGREFNVSLLETENGPRVLPIAEIEFSDWQPGRPRLVGYAAKWDAQSADCAATPRRFGLDDEMPELAAGLARLSRAAWHLLGLRGYARVDFRLDGTGTPTILEINPNPCLEPEAGFAAAALQAGISYADLVDRILFAALRDCHE
jgi:D-alanine-D-alanine ligase